MLAANVQTDEFTKITTAEIFTTLLYYEKFLILRLTDNQMDLIVILVARKEKRYMINNPIFDESVESFKGIYFYIVI